MFLEYWPSDSSVVILLNKEKLPKDTINLFPAFQGPMYVVKLKNS